MPRCAYCDAEPVANLDVLGGRQVCGPHLVELVASRMELAARVRDLQAAVEDLRQQVGEPDAEAGDVR